jgi:hypothetical protein
VVFSAADGSRSASDGRGGDGASVATLPCGASQAVRHVVECSDELDVSFPGEAFPGASRSVSSDLVPRCTQQLKRLLKRFERVGRADVASRPRRSRLESPRVLDQLGSGPTEVVSRLHAAMVVASDQAAHGAQ